MNYRKRGGSAGIPIGQARPFLYFFVFAITPDICDARPAQS
jgi:hypothetical protein